MRLQILQCDPKGFMPLSELIKAIEKTDYSHYAIGFTSITGEYIVLDATHRGVAISSSRNFLKHYDIVREFDIDIKYPIEDFMSWYEKLLGERYGYLQLFGVLFKIKSLGQGIICDELVLRMLNHFTTVNITDIDIRGLNYTEGKIKCLLR